MTRKSFAPSAARSFALTGHRSSGKTSLGDILLRAARVTRSIGRVDEGTSLLDHEAEERRRRTTLGPSFAWMEWEGTLLQLVDTPSGDDLIHERALAITGTDGAVVVVGAPDGVEVGTLEPLRARQARVVVVNKMDRPHRLDGMVERLAEVAGARVLPLQIPFMDDDGRFAGVVCLQRQAVLRYDAGGSGAFSPEPLPDQYAAPAAAAWERLVEAVASTRDDLLEAYLEYFELPRDTVLDALADAVEAGEIVPLLYASSHDAMGAEPILDLLARVMPPATTPVFATDSDGALVELGDEHLVAQVVAARLDGEGRTYHVVRVWAGDAARSRRWTHSGTGARSRVRKLYQLRGPRRAAAFYTGRGALLATWDPLDGRPGSTWIGGGAPVTLPVPELPPPMMAYLLAPASRGDADGLEAGLQRLLRLDPGLEVGQDQLTGGLLLAGTTDAHLLRALSVLRGPMGLSLEATLPPVEYRETPARTVTGVQGVHVVGDGDEVEEFGACVFDLCPRPPDEGLDFTCEVQDEEQIPRRFVPSIDAGVREATRHGPLAGYPVVGAAVRLTGGEYDILFSTEEHFRLAGATAFRAAMVRAGSRLLEPWAEVEVEVPAGEVGPTMSALTHRRGRILGMEVRRRDVACVRASVPEKELRTFAPRLMALTAGRGRFVRRSTHYEALPASLAAEAIRSSPFRSRSGRTRSGGTQNGRSG